MILQPLLDAWGITATPEQIFAMWNATHRKYHTESHLRDLFEQIEARKDISLREQEILKIAAIFHDIVYDPRSDRNEEDSAEFFLKSVSDTQTPDVQQVVQIILDTKHHIPCSPLSEIFCAMDMAIVQAPFEKLLEWEQGIRHEYSFLAMDTYMSRRTAFLQTMVAKYPENAEALNRLIDFVNNDKI